jgi:triosephosphate isomerase
MHGKLVVGNWKMNGDLRRNDALLADLRAGWPGQAGREIAVCVPFPYLWQAQAALSGSAIGWGAQNTSEYANGAHTGEVAAGMIAEFGCKYVIVGHSERRTLYGETDAMVAGKSNAALDAGLTPIVCVGESWAERESGAGEAVVLRQLDAVLARIGARIAETVVAYEPVWAIGTGLTPTAADVAEAHAHIREKLSEQFAGAATRMRVLYGGSVKPSNAVELLGVKNVDGALVGGASLKAADFLSIAEAYLNIA